MKDELKTKEQLLHELVITRQLIAQMRQRITKLEALETEYHPSQVANLSISVAPERERCKVKVLEADDRLTQPLTTEDLAKAIATRLSDREFLKQLYGANSTTQQGSLKPIASEQNAERRTDDPQHFLFPEHPQLRQIFAFIEANYHQSISLNEIAKAFSYSPSYLTSLVRRLTGQTVYQWIVQRRMFQARCLLVETDMAVHQVAEAVGYVDTGHFIKHFRQLHSSPPKTWRELQFGYGHN
ncbi:MAG: AraC family transcriptional regulator [Coleofasciculus sp. S288]|nr:AraC family transcriptional regulator [Coleofasciculus sp. S288]